MVEVSHIFACVTLVTMYEIAGSQLHFLHPQTFEQEAVDMQLFGDQHQYLVEDLEATLSFHDGEVVAGIVSMCVFNQVPGNAKLVACPHAFPTWNICAVLSAHERLPAILQTTAMVWKAVSLSSLMILPIINHVTCLLVVVSHRLAATYMHVDQSVSGVTPMWLDICEL